jgi:prephenate dehydrogenase
MEAGFSLQSSRVAIVGIGLMGGSLALALKGRCAEIVGVSRSPSTLQYASEHGIVERIVSFDEALDCDLVVLAAPVRTIIKQLEQIAGSQSQITNQKSTILIDLGSTKTEIVRAMQSLPARFDPVGGHPMCGKEVAGIQHAETGLYQNKIFILSALERTSPGALALAREMVAAIGAVALPLPAERQDALVAQISHLPYLAASALVRATMALGDEQAWTVAASGFRDTTRVAASDLDMMIDILLTNRAAILSALEGFRHELEALTALVTAGDEAGLRAALQPSQQQRAKMFVQAK